MKKECERTRRMLRRYSRGHVFAPERKRIEQHLSACPHCATEYQSLKRVDETTQFLREITPVEGVAETVRMGVAKASGIRKVLYRPLWLITVIAFVVAGYFLVLVPSRERQEQEWRELSSPAVPDASKGPAAPPPPAAAEAKKQPEPALQAARDPLAVTVTVDDEAAAMRSINDVMRGHGVLRTKRFSETVKEISGDLTAKELLTFFNRIAPYGRVSYSSRRLEEFSAALPLPFVIRLRQAPRPAAPSAPPVTGEPAAPPQPSAGAPARPASEPPASPAP